jgi:hypothetical protein
MSLSCRLASANIHESVSSGFVGSRPMKYVRLAWLAMTSAEQWSPVAQYLGGACDTIRAVKKVMLNERPAWRSSDESKFD